VLPQPDTLQALLDALELFPATLVPRLLVSQVRSRDGRLDRSSLPVLETNRPQAVIAALERHVVPLRAARSGSLLIQLDPVAMTAIPKRWESIAVLDWTARLLRGRLGVLVPKSIANSTSSAPRRTKLSGVAVTDAVSLLNGLEPGERLRVALRLVNQALRHPAS
jgi:hypothetical protein